MISYLPSDIYSAAFEPYGLGARSAGMGGASVAAADNFESIFWNPSGIARMESKTFYSEYRNLYGLGLLRYMTAGYVHTDIGKGAVAFSWFRLDPSGDANYIDYAENTLVISYGTYLFKPLYLGLNGKYYRVNSSIGASGMGLDFGLTYVVKEPWLTFGASVQDLTRTMILWDSGTKERLPLRLRVGVSGKIFSQTLVSAQASWEDQKKRSHHIGLEQTLMKQFLTLRFGGIESDNLWRYSLGLGLQVKFLKLDYGLENQKFLGNTQVFSASVKF